jgi:hypothetical protein
MAACCGQYIQKIRGEPTLSAQIAARRDAHRFLSRSQSRTRALRIQAIIKDSRFLRCAVQPPVLDKAGGDMVHFRVNRRLPKENDAAGIIIHRLL